MLNSVSEYVLSFITRGSIMKSLVYVTLILLGSLVVTAQPTRGRMAVTEGTSYLISFPQVWAVQTEKPHPQPMKILVSARERTTVRFSVPSTISDVARIDKVLNLEPNQTVTLPVSTAYMNTEAGRRSGLGILVTGNRPFSVSTSQSWQGNGEITRHLPIAAWGTSYHAMSFYQDSYGTSPVSYRPGQIVVIAASDETVVTLVPTTDTEAGSEVPSISRGQSGTITLNRGETLLIRSAIAVANNRATSSDLSGTLIRATKPIAVISGHTKGAIARMPDVLPPTGSFAAQAHFVRNNVHDVMYPDEFAGTSFVTVPCLYTTTRVVGQDLTSMGIEDQRGDVIRVIALTANTWIKRRNPSGVLEEVLVLRKGETRVVMSQETAAYWESNHPVLIGQYGKSFARIIPGLKASSGGNEGIQGFPTVECGMPMLQMVPSIDRWVPYAVFQAKAGLDCFLNIVYRTDQVADIRVDNKSLMALYVGAARVILGTPYSYIRTPIPQGNHVIESTSDSVRWMAWNYGSLDGLSQGHAYGSPVSVNFQQACVSDSIIETFSQLTCTVANGSAHVVDPECNSIGLIYSSDESKDGLNTMLWVSNDFTPGDSAVTYSLRVLDSTKAATATVHIVSRAGSFVERRFSYRPDTVSASKTRHDFGKQEILTIVSDTVVLTNPHLDRPIVISRLSMLLGNSTFTISGPTTPFTLAPGSRVSVIVSAKLVSDTMAVDTLVAVVGCVDWKLTNYTCRIMRPNIRVTDVDFKDIGLTSLGRRDTAVIENIGTASFQLTNFTRETISGPDSVFTYYGMDGSAIQQSLPRTVPPGEAFSFVVECIPQGSRGEFVQNAVITTNVPGSEVNIRVRANSVDTTTSVHGEDAVSGMSFTITPQPMRDEATITLSNVDNGWVVIELIDIAGRIVSTQREQVVASTQSYTISRSSLPNGAYTVRVSSNGRQASSWIMISR